MKKLVILFASLIVSSSALAAEGWLKSQGVRQILLADGLYGECMIRLADSPQSIGLDCPSPPWVTVDCAASLAGNSRSLANNKLNIAQLAYIARKKIDVKVTDAKKINGFCYAVRVDLK